MQITPVQPPPLPNNAVAQPQTLPHALPAVQTQAVAPIGQQALAPTAISEKSDKTKEREKRRKNQNEREEQQATPEDGRGGHVNISV